jgi:hypothetical protein
MGVAFTDQFSLLHFAVGVISRYWNISLLWLLVLHTLFEVVENTERGMMIINTYVPFWPGGKTHPDSIVNRIGDTVYSVLGWVVAHIQL